MGAIEIAEVAENYHRIQQRMHAAALRANRDFRSIKLIAVTKTVPAELVRQAVECGARDVGENRLQDALTKIDELRTLDLTWHFIGHIQTNKAKKVAEYFNWIH